MMIRNRCDWMFALLCLGWSGLAAVDTSTLKDVTILIRSGDNNAAGLNRPDGTATVTLKPYNSQEKLSNVKIKTNSPDNLYQELKHFDPCAAEGSTAYARWTSLIAATDPNSEVTCTFEGLVTACTGGGGQPPKFTAKIVHIDLDVDSDNMSEAITAQKQPAAQAMGHKIGDFAEADAQEKLEDPQGTEDKKNPGLLLVVNHGFEQIGYKVDDPKEDWERSGHVLKEITDPDLAKARIQITGEKSGKLKLTYPEAKLRVYKEDKTYLAPGIENDVSPGEIKLLLEGINPGGTDGSCRIEAEFKPVGNEASGDSAAKDIVKVTVVDLQLQVDRDRDAGGNTTGTGKDLTNKDHRFIFWYNNDTDAEKTDLIPGNSNYSTGAIDNLRDMEDFQRMRFVIRGIDNLVQGGQVGLGMRWMPGATHEPRITCFRNDDVQGTTRYLNDESTAIATRAQAEEITEVKALNLSTIDKKYAKADSDKRVVSMLWECQGEGDRPAKPENTNTTEPAEGQLAAVLVKGTQVLAINRHLYLRLGDMRNFYEHWTLGDTYTTSSSFPLPPLTKATDSPVSLGTSQAVGLWDPDLSDLPGTQSGVVFVHGYRMATWERRAFAETMCKRLYWQRFNGKFVLLSWPTEYWASPTLAAILSAQNYDRSEFTARRSGYKLFEKIRSLKQSLKVVKLTLTGHSMGNIVLSEAMRLADQPIADAYLAFQSAEAAEAYKLNAPTKVARGISRFVTPGGYAPDLYGFDAPVQSIAGVPGRSWVTWLQWNARDIVGRRRNGDPIYGAKHLNRDERLVPVADGLPLHSRIAQAVTARITYYNGSDPATAGVWVGNQIAKVDRGFNYSPILLNTESAPMPRYQDEYSVSRYTESAPWSALASTIEGSGRLLSWYSQAQNDDQQMQHAAILSFISESRSAAAGAIGQSEWEMSQGDFWGRPLPNGFREATFNGFFDAQRICGFRDDSDHDHSGQFEFHLTRPQGPIQFWQQVLRDIQ